MTDEVSELEERIIEAAAAALKCRKDMLTSWPKTRSGNLRSFEQWLVVEIVNELLLSENPKYTVDCNSLTNQHADARERLQRPFRRPRRERLCLKTKNDQPRGKGRSNSWCPDTHVCLTGCCLNVEVKMRSTFWPDVHDDLVLVRYANSLDWKMGTPSQRGAVLWLCIDIDEGAKPVLTCKMDQCKSVKEKDILRKAGHGWKLLLFRARNS